MDTVCQPTSTDEQIKGRDRTTEKLKWKRTRVECIRQYEIFILSF